MRDEIYSQLQNLLAGFKIRDFELACERVHQRSYEAKGGAVEASLEAVREGIALRVFRDGRVAFGYTTDLGPDALRRLVETTAAALPFVDPDPDLDLAAPRELASYELKDYDAGLAAVPSSRKIEAAREVEAAAQTGDPRVKHVRSAVYEETVTTLRLRNSRGLDVAHARSHCSVGVMAVAEADGEAEAGYEFDESPFFDRLRPERAGRAAGVLAASYLGSHTPASRKVPVILDPLVSAEVLEVLAASFPGDAVYKKRSFLAGKLGSQVYSKLLQVEDDGLLPEGAASCPFDGEGQPGRRLALIEDGILRHFLLDARYARKLGLSANASTVRRGLQRPPFLGTSNLRIPPGAVSDAELFRDIGAGLLVTEVFGMHATNPVTGDFSVGIQGFLVAGGEKREPVKGLALAGNLHAMMAELRAVGSRFRVRGTVGAPTLAIQEMSVGGG